jgi:hypothetical protein
VSFHYNSSLFTDLNTDLASQVTISGNLPPPPGGSANFFLEWIRTDLNTVYTFSTLADGNWSLTTDLSAPVPADFGTNSNFSVVPVPAAVWLFGSGLICLIGVARRKK